MSIKRLILVLMVLVGGVILTGCATVQAPPELARAIKDGDVNKVESILKENPKLANSRCDIDEGLHSVRNDEGETVTVRVVRVSVEGTTPLYNAVFYCNRDIVKSLLIHGAKEDTKNIEDNRTPIGLAKTLALTDNKRRIREHNEMVGHEVVADVKHEIYELLSANKMNVKYRDEYGNTPLHKVGALAVWGSRKDMTEIFLNKGANVNAKNKNRETPLHMAARFNYVDTANLLIANGAKINAKNNKGKRPLALAIEKDNKEIVDLLKKHGAVE